MTTYSINNIESFRSPYSNLYFDFNTELKFKDAVALAIWKYYPPQQVDGKRYVSYSIKDFNGKNSGFKQMFISQGVKKLTFKKANYMPDTVEARIAPDWINIINEIKKPANKYDDIGLGRTQVQRQQLIQQPVRQQDPLITESLSLLKKFSEQIDKDLIEAKNIVINHKPLSSSEITKMTKNRDDLILLINFIINFNIKNNVDAITLNNFKTHIKKTIYSKEDYDYTNPYILWMVMSIMLYFYMRELAYFNFKLNLSLYTDIDFTEITMLIISSAFSNAYLNKYVFKQQTNADNIIETIKQLIQGYNKSQLNGNYIKADVNKFESEENIKKHIGKIINLEETSICLRELIRYIESGEYLQIPLKTKYIKFSITESMMHNAAAADGGKSLNVFLTKTKNAASRVGIKM